MTNLLVSEQRCKGCGEPIVATDPNPTYCESCWNVRVFRGYSKSELREAFDRVAETDNWKLPIDRTLEGSLSAAERSMIDAAVVFFAGCTPTFMLEGGLCGVVFTRVRAVGYYAAVGA